MVGCYADVIDDSVELHLCGIWAGIRPFTFEWMPAEHLSNPFIEKPMAKPNVSTT
ncbi:MAG: hypothetical protein PF517_08450 [Salinivirgaceae bacterium]|jgi:hypothetical protein|nr:hypothetical protein [Salinivirgaceae bacterium]